MRRLSLFLLLGVALTASATDIWRWKDADGVVHYSDSPFPGAERVNVGSAPASSGTTKAPGNVGPPPQEPEAEVRYSRCVVTQPTNDQTFFAVDSVTASLAIEPDLQAGHHTQVYLNGAAYADWPDGALNYTMTSLNRGSYTLAVRVLDGNGRVLCTGPAINFYVQQPSVLSPQRPPPKKPPPPPPPPQKP